MDIKIKQIHIQYRTCILHASLSTFLQTGLCFGVLFVCFCGWGFFCVNWCWTDVISQYSYCGSSTELAINSIKVILCSFPFFPLTSLVEKGYDGNVKKITKFIINLSYCLLIKKINSSKQTKSLKLDYFIPILCVLLKYDFPYFI